jgi:ABC-type sugar transport system ATPase subunit
VVYNQPKNWFVANFMGQLNSIACTQPLADWLPQSTVKPSGAYTVGFRPEKAVILAEVAQNSVPHVQTIDDVDQLVLTGLYRGKEVLGNEQQIFFQVDVSIFGSLEPLIELKANGSAERCFAPAQSVSIAVPLSSLFFFNADGASLGL